MDQEARQVPFRLQALRQRRQAPQADPQNQGQHRQRERHAAHGGRARPAQHQPRRLAGQGLRRRRARGAAQGGGLAVAHPAQGCQGQAAVGVPAEAQHPHCPDAGAGRACVRQHGADGRQGAALHRPGPRHPATQLEGGDVQLAPFVQPEDLRGCGLLGPGSARKPPKGRVRAETKPQCGGETTKNPILLQGGSFLNHISVKEAVFRGAQLVSSASEGAVMDKYLDSADSVLVRETTGWFGRRFV